MQEGMNRNLTVVISANAGLLCLGTLAQHFDPALRTPIMAVSFMVWLAVFIWYAASQRSQAS